MKLPVGINLSNRRPALDLEPLSRTGHPTAAAVCRDVVRDRQLRDQRHPRLVLAAGAGRSVCPDAEGDAGVAPYADTITSWLEPHGELSHSPCDLLIDFGPDADESYPHVPQDAVSDRSPTSPTVTPATTRRSAFVGAGSRPGIGLLPRLGPRRGGPGRRHLENQLRRPLRARLRRPGPGRFQMADADRRRAIRSSSTCRTSRPSSAAR